VPLDEEARLFLHADLHSAVSIPPLRVKGASEPLSESFTQSGMVGAFYRAVMLSAQHTLSALALLLIAMACTKGP
jgi:hypothetical protein